nr:two-component regulator propeller domain-containing protein [uncultured Draconibacterium sp.]
MKKHFKIFLVSVFLLLSFFVSANGGKLSFIHYTSEDGLPSSYIKSICQDQFGFIWAATRSSVCRFDGKYFKTFKAIDETGSSFDLWCKNFYTVADSGLIAQTIEDEFYFFDFKNEKFVKHPVLNSLDGIIEIQPSEGGMWAVGNDGLFFLPYGGNKFKRITDVFGFTIPDNNAKIVRIKERNHIVVGVGNDDKLYVVDCQNSDRRVFNLPENFNWNDIPVFYLDQNNSVWLGQADNGVYRISLTNGKTQYFSEDQNGDKHLLHNLIHTIQEDHHGNIWIGTENGLTIWSPYTEKFSDYQYNYNNAEGLNTNPIYDIFCDRDGNMWLGTYFGGINLWSNDTEFFKFWHAGQGVYNIGGNVVSSIVEDDGNNIWIATEDMGVNRIDRETGKVTKLLSAGDGLSFNNVHCLMFETRYKLWIGTYTGGINILDLRKGSFDYINKDSEPDLPADNIYSLLNLGDSIYITTSAGIAVYNTKNKKLTSFFPETLLGTQFESCFADGNRIWFSSLTRIYYFDRQEHKLTVFDKLKNLKHINFVKKDSKGRLWVGDCLEGLWCYYFLDETVKQYSESTGFPFSWIFSLEESADGTLWVSGDKGLVKLNPDNEEYYYFDRDSDLPFDQFNFRASNKDSKGNIYFGGNNGMISFNEKEEFAKRKVLNVVFRGMQLFNQPLSPSQKGALKKSLNFHPEIRLKHKQNVFTIEYAGLNFQNKGKCEYAYYLENFEKDWNYVGNRDFVTYTNLSPGTYRFHVKATTDKNEWLGHENTLSIIIEPPFWLSGWGFFIYFLLALLAMLIFYLTITRIQKTKALAEMERHEKDSIKELNNFKLDFFTNVSHELRTPLTLIIGPLSRILEEERLTPGAIRKMKGIKHNAHRLLTLINQLLEFRKIDSGKETLKVCSQNITSLINDIKESFSASAKNKGVKLECDLFDLDQEIWVDQLKLETILINLISNALKFTNKGGTIQISLKLVNEKNSEDQYLNIKVHDTGVGIAPDKKLKIFDRFYKDEKNIGNSVGSGIGLAFVQSLVELHRGKIDVESNVGEGSTFLVQLPVSRRFYKAQEIVMEQTQFIRDASLLDFNLGDSFQENNFLLPDGKPLVLVIDDNEDLLDFISETLSADYSVCRANNGEEGLKKLDELMPDLIISDVMMPGIDGFELCRTLKADLRTSHIPVVLLTAKCGEESEYEGLNTGADYYIQKPFYPQILTKLIENILSTRKNLVKRFKSDLNLIPEEVGSSDLDREFINDIAKLIQKNIDNTELDVAFIVKELRISRSLLHLKLKNLTGCSATEFIRNVRLRQAAMLIAEGKCNISEAAYRTGFSSPTYFTRRFREVYGKSPREYFGM